MKKFILFLALAITPLMAELSIVVQVEKNLQAVGQRAATWLSFELHKALQDKKNLVVILPTGDAAQTMYYELVKRFYDGKLDFSKTVFFNLDEYVGYDFENPLSHAYELRTHFLKLITQELNREKLHFFGLKPLTSKDCIRKRERTQLNQALERFCLALVVAHKKEAHSLTALDKVFHQFMSEDHYFSLLEAEYMNNKNLPSWQSFKARFKNYSHLRNKTAKHNNIHLLNGLSFDHSAETLKYHTLLDNYSNDSNCRVVCLSQMRPGPIQVAYNDFADQEMAYLPNIEKEIAARQSCCRIAALKDDQRQEFAHVFKQSEEETPRHVLTLGLQEILACEKILLLAGGEDKKQGLYEFFSEQESSFKTSSLLKKYYTGQISFLMDEKAYGVGEDDSLFSLNVLQKLTPLMTKTNVRFYSDVKPSFWDIPYFSKPALLDQGHKYSTKNVLQASPIKNSTVLWVKNERLHLSMIQSLKNQNNNLITTSKLDLESLLTLIDQHQPAMIVLPYNQEALAVIEPLKEKIKTQFSQKPILGVFYETDQSLNNVIFPLSKEQHKVKIETIAGFHQSQTSRTRFDLIAQEMSATPSPWSSFNESFSFYDVAYNNNNLELLPLKSQMYITSMDLKDKEGNKVSKFTFSDEDLVLVISPHPDDDVIGMGGLLQHLGETKTQTIVLNATSGYKAEINKESILKHPYLPKDILEQVLCEGSTAVESKVLKSRIRECESIAALCSLNSKAKAQHLRLPFYDHPQGKFTVQDEQKINDALSMNLSPCNRLFFFLPNPNDSQKTHQKVHLLFMRKIGEYCKKHPNQKVVIAFYNTPWTGLWNLYDYSYLQGSRLAALTGSELLNESGQKAPQPEELGGSFAKRYFIFYFNNADKE